MIFFCPHDILYLQNYCNRVSHSWSKVTFRAEMAFETYHKVLNRFKQKNIENLFEFSFLCFYANTYELIQFFLVHLGLMVSCDFT